MSGADLRSLQEEDGTPKIGLGKGLGGGGDRRGDRRGRSCTVPPPTLRRSCRVPHSASPEGGGGACRCDASFAIEPTPGG